MASGEFNVNDGVTWFIAVGCVIAIAAMAAINRKRFMGSRWFDFILPWAKAFTLDQLEEEEKKAKAALAAAEDRIKHANVDVLKDLMTEMTSLREVEAERRRSVDTRLSTIVGLASIAATLATGTIVAEAAGTLKISSTYGRWAVGLVALYIIVQLCDGIYWAVNGQARQGYRIDTVEDLLPQPGASEEAQLRQRITTWVKQLHFNQTSVNRKVTAMGVAHQATKNFVVGLLALSVIGVAVMVTQSADSSASEALRSDAKLLELLRGPIGPQGPIGPAGPIGPPGDKGPAGPPGRDAARAKSDSRGGRRQ